MSLPKIQCFLNMSNYFFLIANIMTCLHCESTGGTNNIYNAQVHFSVRGSHSSELVGMVPEP